MLLFLIGIRLKVISLKCAENKGEKPGKHFLK
jgi:hypothetical protein